MTPDPAATTATAAAVDRPEGVEALVQGLYGDGCRMSGYRMLTHRAASVARVALEGAPVDSVIVKHLARRVPAQADLVADHPEFANELLAYRFLKRLDLGGRVMADLAGFDPAGVMVLQDLGDGDGLPQRGFDYLVPALARSLAVLHGSTRGAVDAYDELRRESGLGGRSDDRRKYGIPAVRRLFQSGAALCLGFEGRPAREVAALARALEDVEATIAAPGAFLALIHDDLANARQTFDVGERLVLLDFEQAKFSHALLDFVKPMIGKFEVEDGVNITVWQCPGFPPDLPRHYREILRREGGPAFSDTDWDRNLAAALIYGALGLVGRMAVWDPRRRLRATPRQNVNALLHRLSVLLAGSTAFPAVTDFLDAYLDLLLGAATQPGTTA